MSMPFLPLAPLTLNCLLSVFVFYHWFWKTIVFCKLSLSQCLLAIVESEHIWNLDWLDLFSWFLADYELADWFW